MSCLNAEILGEVLDGVAEPEALAHTASCADCAGRLAEMRALGDALRGLPMAAERAPASMAATLRGLEAGASTAGRRRWKSLVTFVAATAAAAVLVISPTGDGISQALADEAVSRHLRAFANGTVCEVESADPIQLEAWLAQTQGRRIDVPLQAGVELVGARRCSLFGEAASAVVYRSGEASVTMFVPRPGSEAERACARAVGECREARDGQTVCVVASAGGPRLVVGELPAAELGAVARGS
jgi:anti-sigma factor RsiW